jgi:PEP-CTERM motif
MMKILLEVVFLIVSGLSCTVASATQTVYTITDTSLFGAGSSLFGTITADWSGGALSAPSSINISSIDIALDGLACGPTNSCIVSSTDISGSPFVVSGNEILLGSSGSFTVEMYGSPECYTEIVCGPIYIYAIYAGYSASPPYSGAWYDVWTTDAGQGGESAAATPGTVFAVADLAVPEPKSWVMLLLGLSALALIAKRESIVGRQATAV